MAQPNILGYPPPLRTRLLRDDGLPERQFQKWLQDMSTAFWSSVPASAAARGTAGQMAYDSGFLYICIAPNSWKRVAIAAW